MHLCFTFAVFGYITILQHTKTNQHHTKSKSKSRVQRRVGYGYKTKQHSTPKTRAWLAFLFAQVVYRYRYSRASPIGWMGCVEVEGQGVERGGRIVAASEMLRPSVGHFQQAEVMPRGCKKQFNSVTPRGRQYFVKSIRTVTTQDQSQQAKRDDCHSHA